MKVIRSSICGLCYGVKRACRLAESALREHGPPVYTLGPLMHNPQEVARLASRGILARERLEDVRGGLTLVRTHGIRREDYARARRLGVKLLDTACPHVKVPRRLLARLGKSGVTVLLLGDRGHPEVEALVSFASGPVEVVDGPDKLPRLQAGTPVALLSQTTQNEELFQKVAEECRRLYGKLQVECTICQDTSRRQAEALKLAGQVDAVLVVGGRNSANTSRLFALCRERLARTYHIESAEEVANLDLAGVGRVGLVSGASTPEWVIAAVEKRLGR